MNEYNTTSQDMTGFCGCDWISKWVIVV